MSRTRKPYKTYTKEFKQEAVRMMEESDRPASEIALENRPESARAEKNGSWQPRSSCFIAPAGRSTVHRDLVESGEQVGLNRVARLMRHHGIQSKMARRFVVMTDSRKTAQPASDD